MKNLTLFIIAILIIVYKPSVSEIKKEVKKVTKPAVVRAEEVEEESTLSSNRELSSPTSLEQKIRAKFGESADTALAIAFCESGIREEAIGDGHIAYYQDGIEYGKSYGIFQVRHLPGRPSPEWLLNADNNIEYAYQLFQRSGWNPWSCASRI
jgi:hypothetical protein